MKKIFVRRGRPENENRINDHIKASKVRLVEGDKSNIISLEEALSRAKNQEQDLVQITKNQEIPIVKIVDYGKFKFNKAKKEKENKKKQKTTHIKEVKMGPKIDINDFQRKCLMARSFLEGGDTVKVTMRFRG